MSDSRLGAEVKIDFSRIKRDIAELSKIGRRSEVDPGLYRMAFTDADMEGKRWLLNRIEEADLLPVSDGAGNIFGKIIPEGPAAKKPSVLVGSHIDTVPCAGTLDGSLGVVIGLECLRAIRASGVPLARPLELVAFSDEEGRFGAMFGSEAFCGFISPSRLRERDLEGISLSEAMLSQGLDPSAALDAARPRGTVDSYLELHIEQGPVLDSAGEQVGIVENITGLFKWQVRLVGDANHAGTTPMEMRNDAFIGLADFAHEISRILEENGGEHSRATIGTAQILPGSANTVPGMVEFSLDVRDTSEAILEELKNAFRKALSAIARRRKLKFEFDELSSIKPIDADARLVENLEDCAKNLGLRYRRMPSGAAHDAQMLARIAPMGMIFTPSRGGRSHSPEEWTSWEDMEAGARLCLEVLLKRVQDPKDLI